MKKLLCLGLLAFLFASKASAITYSGPPASSGGGTPGGSDTQVQYNGSGSFAGSANFTYNGATVTVAGAVQAGSVTVSGSTVSVTVQGNSLNIHAAEGINTTNGGGANVAGGDTTIQGGDQGIAGSAVISGGQAKGAGGGGGGSASLLGGKSGSTGGNAASGTGGAAVVAGGSGDKNGGAASVTGGEKLTGVAGNAGDVTLTGGTNSGGVSGNGGSVILNTGNGPQQRGRIDLKINGTAVLSVSSSSNVGIGDSDPQSKLSITGQEVVTGTISVTGRFKLVDGTQGAAKVLTSDANGLSSWQTASGGGGSTGTVIKNSAGVTQSNEYIYRGTVSALGPTASTTITLTGATTIASVVASSNDGGAGTPEVIGISSISGNQFTILNAGALFGATVDVYWIAIAQ